MSERPLLACYTDCECCIEFKPLAIKLKVMFGNKVMVWIKVRSVEGGILYGQGLEIPFNIR